MPKESVYLYNVNIPMDLKKKINRVSVIEERDFSEVVKRLIQIGLIVYDKKKVLFPEDTPRPAA